MRRTKDILLAILLVANIFFVSGCTVPNLSVNRRDKKLYSSYSISISDIRSGTNHSQVSSDIGIPENTTIESGSEVISLVQNEKENTEESHENNLTEPDTTTTNIDSRSVSPFQGSTYRLSISGIPPYSGSPSVVLNGNVPGFSSSDLSTEFFEHYSDLDSLGRCGVAFANICPESMPTEPRGEIGMVKPSGWHTIRYDDLVDGRYLYNRCHLIAYSLAGENANVRNLITGTRWMNIVGMLAFESEVEEYVKSTGNHVLYRSSPIFEGNNLVATGVQIEALSVEDSGKGVCFNVFVYNVQPGIIIDYATGDSHIDESQSAVPDDNTVVRDNSRASNNTTEEPSSENSSTASQATYVLNLNSKKFHKPTCSSVATMSDKNKKAFFGTREEAVSQGYEPCKRCNP